MTYRSARIASSQYILSTFPGKFGGEMNVPETEGHGFDWCREVLAFAQYHGNNHDDFQLMAEFHEQIGPNPVFMIPDKPAGIDHFDINSFAVCLLSKDVQDSAHGFKAGRGSQTVIHFNCRGFHSYVFAYYFTLCDIHARGYMRQFCMTFVSPDRDKLMRNFVPMKMQFDEVAAFLCHGNHKIFHKDVEKRLKDLNLTLELLEQTKSDGDDDTDGGVLSTATTLLNDVLERDPESVRALIDEMNEIKADLENEMRDPKYLEVEHQMAAAEFFSRQRSWTAEGNTAADKSAYSVRRKRSLSDSGGHSTESSPYPGRRILKHDSRRFERKLRPLHELAPQTYNRAHSKLEALHREFSLPTVQLTVKEEEAHLWRNTASVISLGNLPVLSFASGVGEGEEEFRTPHGSPPPACTEEGDGLEFRTRVTSEGSMVIVSNQSSPSIGGDEKSAEGEAETDGRAEGSPVTANLDTPVDTPFPDNSRSSLVGPHPVSAIGRDTDTQPSPSVDNVTQLSSSVDDVCELLPATDNVTKSSTPVNTVTQPSPDNDGNEGGSNTVIPPSSQGEHDMSSPRQDGDQPKVKTAVTFQFETGVESAANDMNLASVKLSGFRKKRKLGQLVINGDESSDSDYNTPAEDKTVFFVDPEVQRGHLDDPEMWRTHSGTWQCYTDHIFSSAGQDKKRAGRNILAFCRHHGAAKDILYALLRGRMLVILGRQRKQVQSFVQTLRLFVPGSGHEHKVCNWLDGGKGQDRGGGSVLRTSASKVPVAEESILAMSHLQDYKLVGMNSAYSIPKQLQGLVSSWDIDTGKLQTPAYNGKLLISIVSRIKYESEEEFVARIHSVFVELTMKAFIYYHALMKDRLQRSKDLKVSRRVLGLLNSESDSDIVKYLSSIVVNQQLVEAGLRTPRPCACITFKPNKRIECKARH